MGLKLIFLTGALVASQALSGCGAIAEREEPTQTDYIMVSTGQASLLYKAFVGGVEYCKVTKHGIQHVDFDGSIEWDGKTCKVRATVNDD